AESSGSLDCRDHGSHPVAAGREGGWRARAQSERGSEASFRGRARASSQEAVGRTMNSGCRIELFGWLQVVQGERTISRFPTRQTGGLLAYLAFHLHRSHPRDVLMEILWPEEAL